MRGKWVTTKLGNILQKTETVDPTRDPNTAFKYIDVSSVNNETFQIETPSILKGKDAPSRARKLVRTNDVIFAMVRPTLKRIAIIQKELNEQICSTGYFVLRTNGEVHNKLIFYYLQSDDFIAQMEHLQRGASYPAVSEGDIKNQSFSYPESLQEQTRIVEILDKSFGAIDKAKANVQKNLQNTNELFENYLYGVFNKIIHWEIRKVKDLAIVVGGYSFKSQDFKNSGKFQVLRMGNVRPGFIREAENPVFVDDIGDSIIRRALLQYGDVIITQTGTKSKRDYGFTAIVDKRNYLLNQRIAGIRFSERYMPKFFLYFSWTNFFKDQYFANETGTVGQGNVGIGAVSDARIPFNSIEEQKAIVGSIDALLSRISAIQAKYRGKLYYLEQLKISVLKKAFSGQLTNSPKTLIT